MISEKFREIAQCTVNTAHLQMIVFGKKTFFFVKWDILELSFCISIFSIPEMPERLFESIILDF